MKNVARAACLLTFTTLTSLTTAASAGNESAAADQLFQQGREALEHGDFVTACSKLAESNRLERAVGTLISLAQCEEKLGKLAGARQHWQEAAAFADAVDDRLKRGDYAREHFASVDPRVPRLTVKPETNAPANMTISCDDVALTAASLGTAFPLDPGKHTLVVSAPNHEPRSFDVVLAEGDRRDLEVAPGVEKAPAPVPMTAGETQGGTTLPQEDKGTTHRIVAYGLGGLGIVGLGLGTAFGLMASSSWSDAQDGCKRGPCDPASRAQSDKDSASTQGNVSTVAFIGGGALLAAAIVVWLVAPSSSSSSTSAKVGWGVTPGPLGGSAAYRF